MDPFRVLLLEDGEADARRIRGWLLGDPDRRFDLVHARTLGEALSQAAAARFDVALLDLCVPDSEGLPTFRRFHAAFPTLPVVVQSGIDADETAVAAVAEGAEDYLVKRHMNTDALRRALRYAIERRAAQAALRESEERYKLAVEGANDGIWDWDLAAGRIHFAPRFAEMLGFAPGELGDRPSDWFALVHPDDLQQLAAAVNRHLDGRSPKLQEEYRLRHKDGRYRWVQSRGLVRRDPRGAAVRMAGSTTDVTHRKNAEHRLMRLALYDELTGLANRALFLSRLSQVIRRHKRHRDYRFAVLFVDLDRFKRVNDSLGHLAGDELLVTVARRLEGCVRPGDTVSRLGGDEFALLLDDLDSDASAEVAARRIHEALGLPVVVRGQEVFTSASIGIAAGASGRESPEELLRRADLAMYHAKRHGRGASEQFHAELQAEVSELLQLETDLRHALENGEFELHYQPIVELQGGRITGFEALARWRSQARGLVQPQEFVPFAEETGLIGELGLALFRRVCEDMAPLLPRAAEGLSIGVNVSGKQFLQADLAERMAAILDDTGFPPRRLVVELTETALMENPELATRTLERLREMGVRVHLDDFGTGYSSLSCLQRLPIDSLKIDRSFVGGLATRDEDCEIVRAIVGLARSLGKGVVAEGIESTGQLDRLRLLGCERGQGFLFSAALDADTARAIIISGEHPAVGMGA
jgi:diguanylate cyclase (GGDEF)-like protein/PAS domain S-box-containing protein